MKNTPIPSVAPIVEAAREAFASGRTRPLEWRKAQLRALHALVEENEDALVEAVQKDLRKPRHELATMEISMAMADAANAIDNLDEWARPERVHRDLLFKADGAEIRREPLGVVLIMGAWNYPVQLIFVPLVGAIAAGNTAVIRCSEVSPHTAQCIADLVPRYLDPQAFPVVNGGVDVATETLRQRFDHIFYTGSGAVARVVMRAAAENLTPVTLELGGKSPVYVDASADLANAGRRIAWGRFANAGQTCVAPDYVLCHPAVRDRLVEEIGRAVTSFYGDDPQQSPDLCRIVNARHFARVKKLIDGAGKGARVAVGGQTDEKDLYVAPTVVVDVDPGAPLMRDEIFGPVLPVHVVPGGADEAVAFINARDKPLALYVFATDRAVVDRVVSATSSGGVTVNDTLMHAGLDTLPFGGVGESGMGAYHGRLSFDALSHKKALLTRSSGMEFVNDVRYPPYRQKHLSLAKFLLYKQPRSALRGFVSTAVMVGGAAAAAAWVYPHVRELLGV